MAPGNFSSYVRIVKTLQGSATGGTDDRYITEDGRVWRKANPHEANCTQTSIRGELQNGFVFTGSRTDGGPK